ncbi:hypothetical protein pb186bvf_016623 [Paramecium bursaria]
MSFFTRSSPNRRQSSLALIKVTELPQNFAEQILQNDIRLVMSRYRDMDALNQLIQLYMQGVEHYESKKDVQQEYFKAKLQNIMNHPEIFKQAEEQNHKLEFKAQTIKILEEIIQLPEFVKKEHETTKTLENLKESNTNINKLINKTQELLREINEDQSHQENINIMIELFTPSIKFSASWRYEIAFKFKGLQYKRILDDKASNKEFQVHVKINNKDYTSYLPTLYFIDQQYPNPPLLLVDIVERAYVRGICETVNAGMQPYHEKKLFDFQSKIAKKDINKEESAKVILKRGFDALELLLQKYSGKYSLRDQITLADLFIYTQARGSDVPFKVGQEYSLINKVVHNLEQLNEFKI